MKMKMKLIIPNTNQDYLICSYWIWSHFNSILIVCSELHTGIEHNGPTQDVSLRGNIAEKEQMNENYDIVVEVEWDRIFKWLFYDQ